MDERAVQVEGIICIGSPEEKTKFFFEFGEHVGLKDPLQLGTVSAIDLSENLGFESVFSPDPMPRLVNVPTRNPLMEEWLSRFETKIPILVNGEFETGKIFSSGFGYGHTRSVMIEFSDAEKYHVITLYKTRLVSKLDSKKETTGQILFETFGSGSLYSVNRMDAGAKL